MLDDLNNELKLLRHSIKRARIGKVLPDSFYISRMNAEELNPTFFEFLNTFIDQHDYNLLKKNSDLNWNVFKIAKSKQKCSLLVYEDPHQVAFPELLASTSIDLENSKVSAIDYRFRDNRFILHRKELLFVADQRVVSCWKQLTIACEAAGLFNEPRKIGTAQAWAQLLRDKGLFVDGQCLRTKGSVE